MCHGKSADSNRWSRYLRNLSFACQFIINNLARPPGSECDVTRSRRKVCCVSSLTDRSYSFEKYCRYAILCPGRWPFSVPKPRPSSVEAKMPPASEVKMLLAGRGGAVKCWPMNGRVPPQEMVRPLGPGSRAGSGSPRCPAAPRDSVPIGPKLPSKGTPAGVARRSEARLDRAVVSKAQ